MDDKGKLINKSHVVLKVTSIMRVDPGNSDMTVKTEAMQHELK